MSGRLRLSLDRMQVEGGFLSGLDLAFPDGLTTIIGPRGAGKTSLVELIRFVLGIPGRTPQHGSDAQAHARAVLGSGQVVLSVRIGDEQYSLARTAEEEAPRLLEPYPSPIILSQGEVESLGLNPGARLDLIDSFRDDRAIEAAIDKVSARIRAASVEHSKLLVGARNFEVERTRLVHALSTYDEIANRYRDSHASLAGAEEQRTAAETLTAELARVRVELNVLEESRAATTTWTEMILQVADRVPARPSLPSLDEGPLKRVCSALDGAQAALRGAAKELRSIGAELEEHTRLLRLREAECKEKFRQVRNILDGMKEGAGAVAKEFADAQARRKILDSLVSSQVRAGEEVKNLAMAESDLLDRLDALRSKLRTSRLSVCEKLTKELAPSVKFEIEQSGTVADYAKLLAGELRGSGLRYGALATDLASKLSPRELVAAVRMSDAQAIADVVGIPKSRAQKMLDSLEEADVGGLLTARLDDLVTFYLLDGGEYKPTQHLSTGQRCTVAISILLCHRDRAIVVDQPEDHLDNAYVASTLVQAIRSVSTQSQAIITTHNANIPVLGDAAKVVVLGSDGDRGFIRCEGDLLSPQIVRHITDVMEGGRDAFERRAKFYAERKT